MTRTAARVLGSLTALVVLVVDQGLKQWLLRGFDIAGRQPVRLAPFLDIVLAWNRGISYSLFTSNSESGRYILLALTLAVTGFLTVWLWRAAVPATAFALGLIIGGALGNAYDRFAFGAVVDFVHVHIGRFSWYIFNGADCAIVVGVALLLLEALIGRQPATASKLP